MSSIGSEQRILERFMQLSIAAAAATIILKALAAWFTGSVGFLSDAFESIVNLVAAVAGFYALRIASKPADDNHQFGHGKAEYVSALVEGAMIFIAAGMIIYTAIQRFFVPQPIEEPGWGLALSTLSSVLNGAVGIAEGWATKVPAHNPREIMAACRAHGVVVIEDCAQAHGARIDGRIFRGA